MHSVIQADREAAASAYFAWIGPNHVIPAKIREGRADDHSLVQAFARHRIAGQAELVGAAEDVLSHRVGDLPTRGYLKDNDRSRASLAKLAATLAAHPRPHSRRN